MLFVIRVGTNKIGGLINALFFGGFVWWVCSCLLMVHLKAPTTQTPHFKPETLPKPENPTYLSRPLLK